MPVDLPLPSVFWTVTGVGSYENDEYYVSYPGTGNAHDESEISEYIDGEDYGVDVDIDVLEGYNDSKVLPEIRGDINLIDTIPEVHKLSYTYHCNEPNYETFDISITYGFTRDILLPYPLPKYLKMRAEQDTDGKILTIPNDYHRQGQCRYILDIKEVDGKTIYRTSKVRATKGDPSSDRDLTKQEKDYAANLGLITKYLPLESPLSRCLYGRQDTDGKIVACNYGRSMFFILNINDCGYARYSTSKVRVTIGDPSSDRDLNEKEKAYASICKLRYVPSRLKRRSVPKKKAISSTHTSTSTSQSSKATTSTSQTSELNSLEADVINGKLVAITTEKMPYRFIIDNDNEGFTTSKVREVKGDPSSDRDLTDEERAFAAKIGLIVKSSEVITSTYITPRFRKVNGIWWERIGNTNQWKLSIERAPLNTPQYNSLF